MSDYYDAFMATVRSDGDQNVRYTAARFCKYLDDRRLSLDRSAVVAYDTYRKRQKMKPGTRAKEWQIIKRLFKANHVEWPMTRGDAPMVAEGDVTAHESSEELMRDLIGASADAGVETKALLAMSSVFGVRRIEMCLFWDKTAEEMVGLGKDDFDFESQLVYISTAKGGRERYHKIPDILLPHLAAYDWRPRSQPWVSKLFLQLKDRAGYGAEQYKGVGWHSVRHGLSEVLQDPDAELDPMTEAEVTTFMRWKDSSAPMARRYRSRQRVDRSGVHTELGTRDEAIDRKAFARIPWLDAWAAVPA